MEALSHLREFTQGNYGALTFDQWNTLVRAVRQNTKELQALRRNIALTEPRVNQFLGQAIVTGMLGISGSGIAYRWLYSWKRGIWFPGSKMTDVFLDQHEEESWSSTVDGDDFALPLVNIYENLNRTPNGIAGDDDGKIGPGGVDMDGPAYPDGFEPQPIRVGQPVPLFYEFDNDGNPFYYTAANVDHDGTCTIP